MELDTACKNRYDSHLSRVDELPRGLKFARGIEEARVSSPATPGTWVGNASKGRRRGREAAVKVGDVIRVLGAHGFCLVREKGSHRRYTAVIDGGTRHVTVAGKDGDDVLAPTLAAIRRQSGLPKHLFRQR